MSDHLGEDALEELEGLGTTDVTFLISIDGISDELVVQEITINEGMNALPMATVRALAPVAAPRSRDLLRKNCELTIERPGCQRHFRGIVWQARIHDAPLQGEIVVLQVATAAHLLDQIVDTYTYQARSVPEIVKSIVERYLGPARRKVDTGRLRRTYPDREYTLQYQETVFNFVARLCEDEGIFFFFDHDAENESHEVMVLADNPHSLPKARAYDGGRVSYFGWADPPAGQEVVTHVEHVEEVGATDVVIAGYDWTNTTLAIREERTNRGATDPRLEIYDHTDALDLHGYEEPQYRDNTAAEQADLRAELLDVSRQSWLLQSTVITAQPGYLLTLTGAPQSDLDQEYLITSASSGGQIVGGGRGAWHATLECVPTALPYRPARRSPRPVVRGPETAVVVGPAGDEIHTDAHGRVRVQFHWDRQHQRNQESSCWLRVTHDWAGNGFGTFFLPRVGMEVLVSFLGGNPDRPLVTGCVYNGTNQHPHLSLPSEKTQSVIRTKSSGSGGGSGYNELRFEDRAGQEFISVHAQRDLREKVLRDRTTEIRHDDRLTVRNDSAAEIFGEEDHCVHDDARWKYQTEVRYDINRRRTAIGFLPEGEGPGDYYINCTERVTTFGDRLSAPQWKDTSNQEGRRTEFESQNSWTMQFDSGRFDLCCKSDPATKVVFNAMDGYVDVGGRNRVMMVAGESPAVLSGVRVEPDSVLLKSPASIKAEMSNGLASIEITPATITLKVGPTQLVVHPAGVTVDGPIFQQSGTLAALFGSVVTRGGKPTFD